MNTLIKLLFTALFVVLLANFLPGITVDSYYTALWVAFTIAFLNLFVRPLLVLFTLPATILTLGLFLFVINAIVVMMASSLVTGFSVSSFFTALLFSLLLSLFRSFLGSQMKDKK